MIESKTRGTYKKREPQLKRVEQKSLKRTPLLNDEEIEIVVSDFRNALNQNEIPDNLTITEWMQSPMANKNIRFNKRVL